MVLVLLVWAFRPSLLFYFLFLELFGLEGDGAVQQKWLAIVTGFFLRASSIATFCSCWRRVFHKAAELR